MAYSHIEMRASGLDGVGLNKGVIFGTRKASRNGKSEIRFATPMERARKRRRDLEQKAAVGHSVSPLGRLDRPPPEPERSDSPPESDGKGETLPEGQKGAAAALERLEGEERQAYRRLQAALERGNPIEIESAQNFWLRCSETLRRLDLAVEVARREAETQVPLRVACDALLASHEWVRMLLQRF
jgi:hypothetical protein